MATWNDGYWWSKDGIRLHYRDYSGGADGRPPILCLHGLTRNARDSANLADRLGGDWRLIVPEMRGRGESGYAKDPMSYGPLTYLQDVEALLDELKIDRFVAIGTSLGGLLTMLLSAAGPGRIVAAVLNDIGPKLDDGGLARIRTYVGRGGSWPTWLHAARAIAENNAPAFPEYRIEEWLAMAKRLCRLTHAGRVVLDYDMKIAEPFRVPGGEAGFDLWPAFESLRETPVLLVRGAISDLLSAQTAAEMAARLPRLNEVVVPAIGHAPTLDEPEVVAAIDGLLAGVR